MYSEQMSEYLGAESWDERYSGQAALWSGKPNSALISEAAELTPGTALDAGCGEGADAIWLAERGWQVTAVDFSGVALGRAADHASERGDDIAARIVFVKEDLTTWVPAADRYDLVTAQYLHLPPAIRRPVFGRLAAAVAPGGMLLLVGHHPSDMHTTIHRPQDPDRYFTGDDVASALEHSRWHIVTNATPERTATDHEGRVVTIRDTVLRAQRRALR
jgi:SAM-dependent methyltransferase